MPSWIDAANTPDCDFPIQNLPFGVFSKDGETPRCCSAIGDRVIDLAALEVAGVLATRPIALADLLELSEGAVIPLAPPDQVSLKADGVTLAEGRYGTFDGTKAVQLERLASVLRAAI